MPLADFLAGDLWLAFRDLDTTEGGPWVRKPNVPSPEKMGEAYIDWRDAKDPGRLTWPYAVEWIRVVNSSD
ncbi:MAG: hypothetical protein AAF266_13500 [Planctomycetota bacterium]